MGYLDNTGTLRRPQACNGAFCPISNGANATQTISATGTVTGGTFTLAFNWAGRGAGQTTAAIPWNATAAQLQAALVALSSIGTGNLTCTGGPLPATAMQCTFVGALAKQPELAMKPAKSLTGTKPNIKVTANNAGATPASPSVCFLASQGYAAEFAWRGPNNQLMTYGPAQEGGLLDWSELGYPGKSATGVPGTVDPGSDPAITCPASGGYQVAFQGSGGKLNAVGAGDTNTGYGMARFTSPAEASRTQ